jgi:hypothetical protein
VEAIVLHLPVAFKPLADLFERTVTLVQDVLDDAQTDLPFDYAIFERTVADLSQHFQRALHQRVLSAWDRDAPHLIIDGELHRRVGRYEATYYTLAGPVELERSLYRPAAQPYAKTVDPVSVRVGTVGAGWLPHTAVSMAFLVQMDPSREAAQIAQQLGVLPYSRSSFERTAHRIGALVEQERERVEEQLIRAYRIPDAATGIAISLDRVATPMEEPRQPTQRRARKGAPKRPVQRVWRMAYCATVSLHDKDGKALHSIRYGRMPQGDVESLVEGLRDDVKALLAQRPTLQVTVLCDGAREMWNLLGEGLSDEALGRALSRLVDLWHLLQKLGKALRRQYDEQQTKAILARWRLRLLNSVEAWKRIRAEIVAWNLEEPEGCEERPIHEALTFLKNQGEAGRLGYAAARRQGRPVGSGPVEATCKSLFNVRFKRSGARWKEQTAEFIVQLRALHLSKRWNHAMELTLQVCRKEVRRIA